MKIETVLAISLGLNLVLGINSARLYRLVNRATALGDEQSLVLSNAVVVAQKWESAAELAIRQTKAAVEQRDAMADALAKISVAISNRIEEINRPK